MVVEPLRRIHAHRQPDFAVSDIPSARGGLDWARRELRTPGLAERRSELLGRLIVNTIPPEAKDLPVPSVLWGIYYAPAEPQTKQRLLDEQASFDAVDDLIEICMRLGMPEILMQFRDHI